MLDFFGYHSATNEYISTKIENITSIHFQNLDYEKILFAKVLYYVVKLQNKKLDFVKKNNLDEISEFA